MAQVLMRPRIQSLCASTAVYEQLVRGRTATAAVPAGSGRDTRGWRIPSNSRAVSPTAAAAATASAQPPAAASSAETQSGWHAGWLSTV